MQKITVYYFTDYHIITDNVIRSHRMATLDAIKRFDGTPLIETAKEVDPSELDDNGLYPKKKTN